MESLVQATIDLKWAHSVTIRNKLAKIEQLAAHELLHHEEFVAGASKRSIHEGEGFDHGQNQVTSAN